MATTYIGGYAKTYGPYAQGGTPPPNQAPSVTINGMATGTVGTQQSFQAIASDSDGQVVKVELCLMANASTLTSYTVLDTDLVSPFVLNWTPSAAGNFNLRMRATDDKGATSFSSVLAVQVAATTAPTLAPPTSLRQSSHSATSNTMAWNAVTGADGYQLRRGSALIYTGPALSFADTGLTAGTGYDYTVRATDSTNAKQPSVYSAVVTAKTDFSTTQLINWVPAGDSLTYGGQVGGPGSGNTYPEQTVALINQAVGSQRISIAENMGIPSRSAHYWLTDTTTYNGVTPVAHAISLIQSGKINVTTLKFGANDLVFGDSGTDPAQAFTPAQALDYVRQVYSALKAGGYDFVFVDFVMNRTGYSAFANFNDTRLAFNRLLLAANFPDGKIDLPSYPLVYGYNAPNSTTYFAAGSTSSGTDGTHLATPGQAETAKPYAQCFARHIPGIPLAGGAGAEPATAEDSTVPAGQPSAITTINPNPELEGNNRTIGVAIANDPGVASVQFYRQPVGGTFANPQAIGGLITAKPFQYTFPFPLADGYSYYYARLDTPNKPAFYSSVSEALGILVTEDVVFNRHTNFTAQDASGEMVKTSNQPYAWSGQSSGSRKVPSSYVVGGGVQFYLKRPTTGQIGTIHGYQTAAPAVGSGGLDKLDGLYSDQDKFFLERAGQAIFPSGPGTPTAWPPNSTGMQVRIVANAALDFDVYLDNAVTPYGTIPGRGGSDIIPAAAADGSGAVIMQMQVFGYLLADSGVM